MEIQEQLTNSRFIETLQKLKLDEIRETYIDHLVSQYGIVRKHSETDEELRYRVMMILTSRP